MSDYSKDTEVLDHGYVKYVDHMGCDEDIIRAARMSTNKGFQGWDEDAKLLKYLYTHEHMTPFEVGGELVIEVQAPIFVFREWHRHRTQCLAGDTELYFDLPRVKHGGRRTIQKKTLKSLHDRWHAPNARKRDRKKTRKLYEFNREVIKKLHLRMYDEESKKFSHTHISDIFYSGVKDVYKVTLENGKQIRCTKEHRFLFESGWRTLEEGVGLVHRSTIAWDRDAALMCNGQPVYKNKDWLEDRYHKQKVGIEAMSSEAGVSYHTIRIWLKKYNLQQRHSFPKGHVPWNTGKSYKTGYKVTEETKQKIREARSGERSNWWRGGITSDRASIGRWTSTQAAKVHAKFAYTCQKCGNVGSKLHAHHVIPVWADPDKARDFDNLTTLCLGCHKHIHSTDTELAFAQEYLKNDPGVSRYTYEQKPRSRGRPLTVTSSKIVNIEYEGLEDTYDITVDGPFHNFVANGIVTHNSFNEMSSRYTEIPDLHYVPPMSRMQQQSQSNKQGSSFPLEEEDAEDILSNMEDDQKQLQYAYKDYLARGLAREVARVNMPVSRYSRMRAKTDLRNWLHFLNLRMAPNAQWEIRQYANAVAEVIKDLWPRTYALFEEYTLHARKFSRSELEVVKKLLDRQTSIWTADETATFTALAKKLSE